MSGSEDDAIRRRPLRVRKTVIRIIDSDSDIESIEEVSEPEIKATKKRKTATGSKPPPVRRRAPPKSKPTVKTATNSDSDVELKIEASIPEVKPTKKRKTTSSKPPAENAAKRLKKTSSVEPPASSQNVLNNSDKAWTDAEWLAQNQHLDLHVAHNILNLFENDNSIPFIARYRRDLTDNMTPEQLRTVKESCDYLKALRKKTQTVLKSIEALGKLDPRLAFAISSARTLDEVDHLYAPFKPGTKKLLSERAKELGLEDPAMSLLHGVKYVDIASVAAEKGLTVEEVSTGIMHIIAYVISHDTKCLETIRYLRDSARDIMIETNIAKQSKKSESKLEEENISKFTNYFEFKGHVQFIKSHQILAINRGESLKILSVKIVVPERIYNSYKKFCLTNWLRNGYSDPKRLEIIELSIKDAYTRYIQPLIVRQTRNHLKEQAEKSSVTVFENNLKNMLMSRPCKGERILGLDPGFKNGCKYALISETSEILDTGVLKPPLSTQIVTDPSSMRLKHTLEKNQCYIIALGNGTACRETERWITNLKEHRVLHSDVKYAIVNENGASIYSCTEDARHEFPDLDTNIISAVSIARRLQDPLSELIKIEPKHLGVGMYQHDLKEKQLNEALDEVIMECVSFVGVNLNTASVCLLRRIAGLNLVRAGNIIEYRKKLGCFTHRQQLKDVKGVGVKIFEQCAGFLRVAPVSKHEENKFYTSPDANYLDRTWIHPESYPLANKFLAKCGTTVRELGSGRFIQSIQNFVQNQDLTRLAAELESTVNVLNLIVEGLTKPIDHDLRLDGTQQPLFKVGLTSINDLLEGTVLTGRVQNVTDFGSFVDIGVGTDGLIHRSKCKGVQLQLGDHVEIQVINVDINRKRIGLKLNHVLNGQ